MTDDDEYTIVDDTHRSLGAGEIIIRLSDDGFVVIAFRLVGSPATLSVKLNDETAEALKDKLERTIRNAKRARGIRDD